MSDHLPVRVSNPLYLLLPSCPAGTDLTEVAVFTVAPVHLLLLLLTLLEHAAIVAVVRLARPVRPVGVASLAPHVPGSAGAHDAVVAVRATGVRAISAPAPTSRLAVAVATAVIRLAGAVGAVGALAFAFHVARPSGANETLVAEVAIASLPSLAALECLLSVLPAIPSPCHPLLVVFAVIRMFSAVGAITTFASPFHVARPAFAHETPIAEVAITARIAFSLGHSLLSLFASRLTTLLSISVLTAVIRMLGAVGSVATLASTFDMTRPAFTHETPVAEVAIAACVALALCKKLVKSQTM